MPNHQLTAEGYAWSERGRELLRAFKVEIQRSGGRLKLLNKMKYENRRQYRFPNLSVPVSRDSIIFNNWHKISIEEICKLVNLRPTYLRTRARFLGLPESTYKRKQNGLLVLNTETGIFYDGAVEAAKSINKNHSVLNKKLIGKRKNNTSFIRV